MDEKTLKALEFGAVLAELRGFASTPPGAARVSQLAPAADVRAVERAFAELAELARHRSSGGALPLSGAEDIVPLLGKAEPAGAYLAGEEFLIIKGNLDVGAALKKLSTPDFARHHPLIAGAVEGLSDQRLLASEISHVFDEKGWIKDDASGELYRIRGEMRSARKRARAVLDDMAGDAAIAEFLQDDIITIREDRFVLMVKAGKHTNIRGVVHGRSGSGASFFVEPFAIVEINNSLAVLRKEEKAEEARILTDLTRFVLGEKDLLSADLDIIGHLDSLQARALFAERTGGRAPELAVPSAGAADGAGVRLLGARHPLLVTKELAGGAKAVPVDVVIEPGCRVLVISGANTGGKTVALKTLGLLTLMVLSGIPVPVDEGSAAVLFDDIFCDIGDSQDLSASLSTFSAHIARLKDFLAEAGHGSLVLFDEIGAGTNPAEGGALALAAIEALKEKGALVVVTTHLNLLKAHAQTDPGYGNASVEFDEDTLRPLYRLRYGVPGASLGLSIARGLGLPTELIEKAGTYLDESETKFMESIRLLEEKKSEIDAVEGKLRELERQRDEAVRRLREGRKEILDKARARVDGFVEKARAEVREATRKAREAGRRGGKGAATEAARAVERAASGAREALGEKKKRKAYVPAVGDRARIIDTATKGDVVAVDGDGRRAELRVGAIKVWAAWEKLEKIGSGPTGKGGAGGAAGTARISKDFTLRADMEPRSSVNIIGMRAAQAETVVTRFLDAAHAGGLEQVEIIHGVGTGALIKTVSELLGRTPFVRSSHRGDPDHGGAGVTVVELG